MHVFVRTIAPLLGALLLTSASDANAATLDFEDLGASLPIDGNFFYDGRSAFDVGDPDATDFSSQGATFNNEFTEFFPGCCWQGFAYSQTTDTTTPGFVNQYSAITGSGVSGSATYGVGYTGGVEGVTDLVTITLDTEQTVVGAYFTNTTYSFGTMLNGDDFAKQFGGTSGDDPDFLALTITGFDGGGAQTGAIEFLLADYRFADNGLDYLIDAWTWVDLSSLGDVASLDFTMASSDTEFGFVNTPAYFAMDDLVLVPEPGTGLLFGLGLVGLAATRRG